MNLWRRSILTSFHKCSFQLRSKFLEDNGSKKPAPLFKTSGTITRNVVFSFLLVDVQSWKRHDKISSKNRLVALVIDRRTINIWSDLQLTVTAAQACMDLHSAKSYNSSSQSGKFREAKRGESFVFVLLERVSSNEAIAQCPNLTEGLKKRKSAPTMYYSFSYNSCHMAIVQRE